MRGRGNRASLISSRGEGTYGKQIDKLCRFNPPTFGFPDRLLSKLRYHDGPLNLTSTLGGQGLYQFRWNSTFDPDYTSAGHQPLYRDTFAAIYDQYAVVRARAIVKFTNITGGSTFIVGCTTDDDTTTTSTSNTIIEQNHAQWAVLGVDVGGHDQHTFIVNWDSRRYLGIDPFTSQTYKTANGTNPSEVSFLNIFAYERAGGTANCTFDITLEQEVLWTELQTPTGS
jgi:hypothetical protein